MNAMLAALTISFTPITDEVSTVATATLSGASLVVVSAFAVGGLFCAARGLWKYFKQMADDEEWSMRDDGPRGD